jgi:hypothetical protein
MRDLVGEVMVEKKTDLHRNPPMDHASKDIQQATRYGDAMWGKRRR